MKASTSGSCSARSLNPSGPGANFGRSGLGIRKVPSRTPEPWQSWHSRLLYRDGSQLANSLRSSTMTVDFMYASFSFLRLDEVWAFESAERLAYVHTGRGRFEIDLSLSAVEASVGRTFLRAHRSWLVNVLHVKELEGYGSEMELFVGAEGEQTGVRIPVSRDRAQVVREALLSRTMGIRPR